MFLKPSNIFYSQHQISATFGKWNRHKNTTIGETLDDLCNGRCKISDIETIKVVKKDGKWCTIDNRRLWVFHHPEAAGKCTEIPVQVIQYCPLTHGRKFSSINGGKSVTIIKGRSPGGTWHKRLKLVTPVKENEENPSKLESKLILNSHNNSEKDKPLIDIGINGHLHSTINTKETVHQKASVGLSEYCQVSEAAISKQCKISTSSDKSTITTNVTVGDTVVVNSDDLTKRMRHIWSGKPLRLLHGVGNSIRLLNHGRKCSSINGGKAVNIRKGTSPGGTWHTRLTPVTPVNENEETLFESERKYIVNNQNNSEKDKPLVDVCVNRHLRGTINTKETVNRKATFGLAACCQVSETAISKKCAISTQLDKTARTTNVSVGNTIVINSDDLSKRMGHIWSGKPLRLLDGVENSIRLLDDLKFKLSNIKCYSLNLYKPYNFNRSVNNRYETRHLRFTQLYGELPEGKYPKVKSPERFFVKESENTDSDSSDYISFSADIHGNNDDDDGEVIATDENSESKEIDYDDDPWSDDETSQNDGPNFEPENDELDVWESESDKYTHSLYYPDSDSSDDGDDFLIAKEVEKREKRELFLNDILSNYTLNVQRSTSSVDNRPLTNTLAVASSITSEPVVSAATGNDFSAPHVCYWPPENYNKQNSSGHCLYMSTITTSNESINTTSQVMVDICTRQSMVCGTGIDSVASYCETIESPVSVGCAIQAKSFSLNCTTDLTSSNFSFYSVSASSLGGASESKTIPLIRSNSTVQIASTSSTLTKLHYMNTSTSVSNSLVAPVTSATVTGSSSSDESVYSSDTSDDEDYEDDDEEDSDYEFFDRSDKKRHLREIAMKYGSCQSIGYLPDIAKGTRDSAENKRTRTSLKNILPRFEVLSKTRKEHIKSIGHQKDKLLEDVDSFKDGLICHINELADISKQQICLKYESYKNDIQSDVEILETFMATLASNVDNFSDENEADLFLKVKTSKLLIDDCERRLSCRDATLSNTDLKFTLNREIKINITSLGSVVNADKGISKYTAKLYKKIEVGRTTRAINGICTMDDGTTVIADRNNSQLLRLDKNFKFKDSISVSREPYSVCNVGSKEVAALINNTSTALGKVQIVSVSQSLKLISSFQVEFGDGLSYDARQDALFICHRNQVSVFTKGGLLLREYKNSDTVGKLFTSPYNLAFSLSNDSMYVLDNMHIKALTKDGEVLWTMQNSGRLICVLPGDIILIVMNNRIIQFNKRGNTIGELLGSSDKHNPPLALAFDRKSSRLLIGCTSNEILVYSLSSE